MSEAARNPLKLFYCYAHEDKALCNTIDSHLSALKRQKLIEIWYDGEISAGAEWEREINKHLSSADIVLLLVSAAFIASDYCYSKEMERALQRHEEGTVRVVPIILRPVDWEDAPFSKLQILPTEAKPVTRWQNPDDAYEDIAKRLRVLVKELHASQKIAVEKWLQKGIALGDLNRYEEALEAFEEAIRLDPKNANVYIGKGLALGNLNRYEEALEVFEEAIRLDPKNAFVYIGKGHALGNLNRYEEALEAYEQAIILDPKNAFAYNSKGIALARLGRSGEADQARKKARELGYGG